MSKNHKIIVILGPTSSGKSDVAIRLAQKFDGEIISADSRQIYRGMDIGTGKVAGGHSPVILSKVPQGGTKPRDLSIKKVFISEGVPHHMIDIIGPRTNFSAAQFKKKADKIIADIIRREKLPIICGGTGFWIKAIIDNITYPEVKPNWKLRKELSKKTTPELFKILKKLDSRRAKNIDRKNKVRLIRAVEICEKINKVPPLPLGEDGRRPSERKDYKFLQIGVNLTKEKLYKNIEKRLKKRFEAGMIEEVKKLKKQGLSWKKIQSFGLGYFLIPEYLDGRIKSKKELFEKIFQAEKDYAKRQLTWFKRDKKIKWIEKYKTIEQEVGLFIK